MVVVIVLSVLGEKAKPLGLVKKIVSALLGLLTLALTFKYLGDASTKYTSAGIGLYFMLLGSLMILVMSFLPAKLIPCVAHKFLGEPKE